MGLIRSNPYGGSFIRQLTLHIIVGITAAILIGGIAILTLPQVSSPSCSVVFLGSSSEFAPPAIHRGFDIGTQNPVLYDECPFQKDIPWLTFREPYDWSYLHEYSEQQVAEGLHIAAMNTLVNFSRYVNIPVVGCETIKITFCFTEISGSFSSLLTLSSESCDTLSAENMTVICSSSSQQNCTETTHVSFQLDISNPRDYVHGSEWVLRCKLCIILLIPDEASFTIESMKIAANRNNVSSECSYFDIR